MKQGKFIPGLLIIGAILIAIFAIYGFADIHNVLLDSPANGTWYNTSSVDFNCTAVTNATEEEVNITLWLGLISSNALTYNMTNMTAATNDTTINFTVQNIPDGAYYWTCEATNMSFETPVRNLTNYTVYIDTAKPHTIELNSLANGLNTTDTTNNFNWTASDAFNAFASSMTCNLTIDSVINKTVSVTNGTMANFSIEGFADGIHYWNISSCNDSALNVNLTGSETRYFTVDANPPQNIALNIANGTWKASSTVNFNWTATNTGTSVLYCNLTVDGTVNKSITAASGVMANSSVEGLADGLHKWYANCSTFLETWNHTGSLAATADTVWVDTVNPVVTLSVTPSSVYQLASAVTIGCDATDATDASVTSATLKVLKPNEVYSQDLDGTFTDTSLVGTYTVTCSTTDSAGNSATSTSSFTVDSGVTTGSSSGSGSSSSAASTASVSTTLSIVAGTPGIVTVSNSNIAVSEISLDTTESASNVKVSVGAISAPPTGVAVAKGNVYKYLDIKVENLASDKLESAKISFFVTKAWLTEKGLDSSDIELKRYTTQWVSLPTTVKSSDAAKVYFEAETPGFSTFAIGAKEAAVPAEEAPAEEVPAEETPAEEVPAEAAPVEQPVKAAKSYTWLYAVIAVIVIAAAVAVVMMKRKK